jgi:hypothetical protein
MKPKEIGRALLAIWSDLTAERVWQYQELPPFLVVNLKELNLDTLGDSEHSRGKRFWSRRPKVVLYESGTALSLSGLCGLLGLNIAFARLHRSLRVPNLPVKQLSYSWDWLLRLRR